MHIKQKNDLHFGKCNEVTVLSTIQSVFSNDIKLCTDPYATIDYCSNDYNIELKSRRIKHDKYHTAMIGKNKIDYLLGQNKKGIILYKYLDGLYYVEINKETVNKFVLAKGGRYDRGKREISDIYYIPIKLLKRLVA